MGELIGIIFIVGFCWFMCVLPEKRFDNYLPPEGQSVDFVRFNRDLSSGVSHDVAKNRMVNGYYNVKKDN